jgi:anaerobic magnesium-protoporphyrin IX monomethyl ester cyclase
LEMITANAPKTAKGLWFRNGKTIVGYGQADVISDLDSLPFAAWDLLPMNKYRAHHWQAWEHDVNDLSGFAVLYTSLGCPFDCAYCSVNVVYGKHIVRYRSPQRVVRELELLVNELGVKYVEIIDDTFTLNEVRVERLCDAIIERGLGDKLRMWCFARADRVSERLMDKMRRAGIEWVFMGFESGKDLILESINKQQTVEQIRRAVDIVHSAGIHVGGNYVFGLPGDTQESMQETLALAKELNTEYANFFITMCYPGTKILEVAKEKGYPLPERWGQYGFFAPDAVPMRTEALTGGDILKFRDNAFKEYFGSERYQRMIRWEFGQKAVDYINNKVLSKEIVRVGGE